MPPTETQLSQKVEARDSPVHGRGLFAVAPIRQGELVVRFGGKYVKGDDAEKAKANGKLVMQWDEDLFSVEDRGDDEGYFINHSCDSNLWMRRAFSLVARRDIEKGEELNADYVL